LIFLFLFISPSFAAVDVNQTVKLGTVAPTMMRCINSTDNAIYCYIWSVEGAPTYTNKLVRVNATGLNQTNCTLTNYTAAPALSRTMMNLLNATHLILRRDDSGCDVWNITDLGNGGTCTLEHHYSNVGYQCQQMMFASENAMMAASSTDIYTLSTGGSSMPPYYMSQANYSNFTAGWWNKTITWYGVTNGAKILNMPDKTVNILYESSHGYYRPLNPPFLKYVGGTLERVIDSPLDNETICTDGVNTTYFCANDMVKSGSEIYLFAFDNTKDRVYRLNFSGYENTSAECNMPTGEVYHIGTQCIDGTRYANTLDNCTVTIGECPTGFGCSQLTPQYNATYSLTTNIIDCSKCYYVLMYNWTSRSYFVAKSNCLNNTECLYSTNAVQAYNIFYQFVVIYGSGVYTFNQTIPSGTTATFERYTIMCVNGTDGMTGNYVIDENGNQTTESEYVFRETGVNITGGGGNNCPNTTTTCYDSNCNQIQCYSGQDAVQSWRNTINSSMGSPFGADIIGLLAAGAISLFIYLKTNSTKIEVLLAPMLLIIGSLSFIGFMTVWFIILEGALMFALIFWKVRGG